MQKYNITFLKNQIQGSEFGFTFTHKQYLKQCMEKIIFKTVNIKNERQWSLRDKKKVVTPTIAPAHCLEKFAGSRAAGVT